MTDSLGRREFLARGAALVGVALVPVAAASPAEVDLEVAGLFGDRPISAGRIRLEVPPISENGYSVPLAVEVESPMTAGAQIRTRAHPDPHPHGWLTENSRHRRTE